MSQRPNTCLICHQRAFGYNYEVVSCNACKMFFRRCSVEKIDELCRWSGKCFDAVDLRESRPRCRPCRYEKCLLMGMRPRGSDAENEENVPEADVTADELAVVPKTIVVKEQLDCSYLQYLGYLHKTRTDVYTVINICDDPSFCDLVARGHSKLGEYARPQAINWESTDRKLKPWGSLGVLVTAEVCKTLDVYNELLLSDRVLLLKNAAFKSHHLAIAYVSYSRKKARVFAPHDVEMFPASIMRIPECRKIVMKLLTAPVEPLIELSITEHEFLLLNMIVICNPGIGGLSPGGQKTLAEHQQRYAKLLLDVCLRANRSTGPARFAAILAINQKLDSLVYITQKMDNTLRLYWEPNYYLSKVIFESLENCKWMTEGNKRLEHQ